MARSFNGTSDKVAFTSGSPPTAATFSAWIRSTLVSTYGPVVDLFTTNDTKYYVKSNGTSAFYVGGSGTYDGSGAATFSANVWYNIVFTWGNLSAAAPFNTYVNSVLDFNGTANLASTTGTTALYGNDAAGAHFFGGSLADPTFWNVVLSTAEILALSKGVRPSKIRPNNLVFWHPLDGLQSPEPDFSGNAHNGTLTGTALASGPPIMMLTPRWPQTNPAGVVTSAAVFRRTLSSLGTRTGSRQLQGWSP